MEVNETQIKQIVNKNAKLFFIICCTMIALYWITTAIAMGLRIFTPTVLKWLLMGTVINFILAILLTYLYSKGSTAFRNEEELMAVVNAFVWRRGIVLMAAAGITLGLIQLTFSYLSGFQYLLLAIGTLTIYGGYTACAVVILFYFAQANFFQIFLQEPRLHALYIGHKIVIPILVVVTLVILLSSMIAFSRFSDTTVEAGERSIQMALSDGSNDFSSFVEFTSSEIAAWGLTFGDELTGGRPADIYRQLQNNAPMRGQYFGTMFAATANGYAYSENGKTAVIANESHFRQAMETGRLAFSELHKSYFLDENVVSVVVPVTNDAGRLVGIVGAEIKDDYIIDLLISETEYETVVVFLLDPTGRIFMSTNKDYNGLTIGKSPELTDDGVNVKNINSLLTADDMQFFNFTLNGKDMHGCKLLDVGTSLSIAIIVEQAEINQGLQKILLFLIGIVGFAFTVIFIPSLFIVRSVTKNLSNPMEDTVMRLVNGELTMTMPYIPEDEFGRFMRVFIAYTDRMRSVVSKIADITTNVEAVSREFESTSRSLSEGTQSRAASVEEATAAIEEVSSSVEQINEHAGDQVKTTTNNYGNMEKLRDGVSSILNSTVEALSVAQKGSQAARNGNRLMQNTIAGMNNIDASIKKIADMIRLISDISDQVTLLALNASIESARAGEQGKGFAVVAEEISKLADETSTTAKTISDLVRSCLKEVARGRKYADDTHEAFDSIIENIEETEKLVNRITEHSREQFGASELVLGNIRKLNEMAEHINTSTNEQMITNQEMAKTIEQINQGTLSEAARAEEIASSAAEISAQATVLRQEIQAFKL